LSESRWGAKRGGQVAIYCLRASQLLQNVGSLRTRRRANLRCRRSIWISDASNQPGRAAVGASDSCRDGRPLSSVPGPLRHAGRCGHGSLRSGRSCCHRLRSSAAQRGEHRHVLAAAAADDVLDHAIDLGAARSCRCRDRRGATSSPRRRWRARATGAARRCGGRHRVVDWHRDWLRRPDRSGNHPWAAMGSRRASCGSA